MSIGKIPWKRALEILHERHNKPKTPEGYMYRHVDRLCGAMLIIKMPVLGTGAGLISVKSE